MTSDHRAVVLANGCSTVRRAGLWTLWIVLPRDKAQIMDSRFSNAGRGNAALVTPRS
jgi:hypothetical protein